MAEQIETLIVAIDQDLIKVVKYNNILYKMQMTFSSYKI